MQVITGHEEEIAELESQAYVWESDVAAQLRHIAATANDQIYWFEPNTKDIYGNKIVGKENVSEYALQAIESCIARIRAAQKQG